jgi:mitogen-activated protein kinase kinase
MLVDMTDIRDTATGSLKFKGAVLSSEGVNFGNGREFKATIDDFEKLEELGRGNYGTVWKVVHKLTKVQMAMKEIRLSLEESVFSSIVMELDVLHKAACPEIVEFFGAFFVEGCVYILMEFMDCGSLEKVYTTNVEEGVLAKITLATVRGLRTLKDQHNIIHRDVKPTNILLNSKGEVKLCDFGVSGNLVASIARTNIGCQSYMAPERIKSENASSGPATYTVHSDIWSLGLSILELAKGGYPYPPETYNNIFAQLQAICDGEPPHLPEEHYSDDARDFVRQCLHKSPTKRPLYAQLLRHPWLVKWASTDVDMTAWVERALEQTRQERAKGTVKQQPALHSFNTQQKV